MKINNTQTNNSKSWYIRKGDIAKYFIMDDERCFLKWKKDVASIIMPIYSSSDIEIQSEENNSDNSTSSSGDEPPDDDDAHITLLCQSRCDSENLNIQLNNLKSNVRKSILNIAIPGISFIYHWR